MKALVSYSSDLTLKKAAVLPPLRAPYLIFVCFARSSALSIGESILSTVRNAAKLAVYEEIMIKVKNHHIPATIRVDTALGMRIQPVQSEFSFGDAGSIGNAFLRYEFKTTVYLLEDRISISPNVIRPSVAFIERIDCQVEITYYSYMHEQISKHNKVISSLSYFVIVFFEISR